MGDEGWKELWFVSGQCCCPHIERLGTFVFAGIHGQSEERPAGPAGARAGRDACTSRGRRRCSPWRLQLHAPAPAPRPRAHGDVRPSAADAEQEGHPGGYCTVLCVHHPPPLLAAHAADFISAKIAHVSTFAWVDLGHNSLNKQISCF